MPLPQVERVIYKLSPLERVICQLRFPAILRIDSELPAQFQDSIRGDFPNLDERMEYKFGLPISPEELPPEILQQALEMSSSNKNYEFASEDGTGKVNLTRTFISLSTTNYNKWENFIEKLATPLTALIDIYTPSYFSRIGLRYINVVRRSTIGLQDTDWSELLVPEVLGTLASSEIADEVDDYEATSTISLGEDEGTLRIVSKLVRARDDGELGFSIDSDFFTTNRTNINDINERLFFLHEHAARLLRWAITEKLHNALEPKSL